MKQLVLGILAHVDSGKTTLAEALLYRAGVLRRLGRVDHRDAFLDTDALERARGITIFAKQAVFTLPEVPGAVNAQTTAFTLLDTPGHVDFSAEAERTLQVLDYAVLVVSGSEGVQSHTETLWHLLERYRVPTFLFVNKMDLPGADGALRLRELQGKFGESCLDFSGLALRQPTARAWQPDQEALALCSEPLLERVLAGQKIDAQDPDVITAIARRELFPCFFGSALRLTGVDALLCGLQTLTRMPATTHAFGARVFKISQDAQGARLTHLKVTGGVLHVKDAVPVAVGLGDPGGDTADNTVGVPRGEEAMGAAAQDAQDIGQFGVGDAVAQEKADQLRIYNGEKFQLVSSAGPGVVCAVTGLRHTKPGQGIGSAADGEKPLLSPVLSCRAKAANADAPTLLRALRVLEQEDPMLQAEFDPRLSEVRVRLMGEVQTEILLSLLQTRFGLDVTFSEAGILYKETLTAPVDGVGHFEPLRHYAEVHLHIEPAPRGSGITLRSACRTDDLDRNWQRLILSHLAQRSHPGVLTGAPLTDVEITLTAGRAHPKHTEGGDFREATYRALRQALRTAAEAGHMALLEPRYAFTITLPTNRLGRAMSDLQRRGAAFALAEAPDEPGASTANGLHDAVDVRSAAGTAAALPGTGLSVLRGRAPVACLAGYARELTAYTHGAGRLVTVPDGYMPCHNADQVIACVGYDADADVENPADSIFCSHGAGVAVPWREVPARAHCHPAGRSAAPSAPADPGRGFAPAGPPGDSAGRRRAEAYRGSLEQDKELLAIFERTYGPIRRRGEMPGGANHRAGAPDSKTVYTAFRSPKSDASSAAKAGGTGAKQGKKAAVPTLPEPPDPEYLLVDGYNVIFSWEELRAIAQENLDAARRRLMDILCNYAGYRRCVPILVFDAYRVKGGVRDVERIANLYVVYTREAETADMLIERATHELAPRRRTRVVSSDGAEQMIILGHGALRVSARMFAQEVSAVEAEIRTYLAQDPHKT